MIACGIDIGTTNLKVVLVDERGRPLWRAAVPSPRVKVDGAVVTDAEALLHVLEDLVIAGWREQGRGEPFAAICTAGVGEDGVGLTADLAPTDVCIPWFDTRAAAEADELHARFDGDPRAGLLIEPTRTAAKWLWLARHRKQAISAARHWITLTDYPSVAWSGEAFISESLAARTACYDVRRRTWIDERLSAVHAPGVPPVKSAGVVIGTGARGPLVSAGVVSERTLLVAGGHDHPIAASAVQRQAGKAIVDSMGTADVLYGEMPDVAVPSLDHDVALSVPVRGGRGLAALVVLEMSAGLAPFRSAGVGGTDVLAKLLAKPSMEGPPSPQPFVPSPVTAEQLRVRLTSLGAVEAAALARAALEGCTFFVRGGLERMTALGVPQAPLFATGGWSRSRGLVELRATILRRPVLRVLEPELTAFGAAMLALDAVAPHGTAEVGLPIDEVAPRAEWAHAYEQLYEAYQMTRDPSGIEAGRSGDRN